MSNRLAGATSPYLRQHATNPVDWQPWDEEALALARREDRPILLSIGYSACHWCHVMAHESFEDPEVARVMNAEFVNIKVDREERPDLDHIYQTAHALLTRRSGGWPLTMFLTPRGEPFYAGTYFPREARYGLPGFRELLPRIAAAYHEQGSAIVEQSERLVAAMNSLEPSGAVGALPARAPGVAMSALKRTFDPVNGGFGGAPKFPRAAELDFCLRAYATAHDAQALQIVRTTLARMADGGIHDQLGGGFCRYSVDAEWTIPHFEKMLYDNAALVALYADVGRVTGESAFGDVARGIAGWMAREMRAPDGGLFSSLDADSEGEEGRFYVWQRAEVEALLPAEEWAVIAPLYGLDAPPNFEGHAWHLRIALPIEHVAQQLRITKGEAERRAAHARQRLFERRERRVRPGRDDKRLTSWNALAAGGLAHAARALRSSDIADMALTALDVLRDTAWRDRHLYAVRGIGDAQLRAYLDDHAFLLAALIEVMQTRFRVADWRFAIELADTLLARFEDWKAGGFWFTSHDHEKLFHRSKPGHDQATPSGNGVAAQALIVLGHMANEPRYLDAAERTVRLFANALASEPGGMSSLLSALEDLQAPPTSVILDGDRAQARRWQESLERTYRPTVRVICVAGVEELPAALRKGAQPTHGVAAWVCRGTQCLAPIHALDELTAALDAPV
ncbi:MAG TPA: thioredoxin domain-containing protein [Casimicrobiaceae bacterium]|nr:thioredoxin domain-containing protein [Casimicrobiaceae bacterium]